MDTNVLLELYRFTPSAREELLVVLRHLRKRLWVSHQVAQEYYARRVSAVKEHLALYESVPEALEEQKKKALQELYAFAKRCSISNTEKEQLTKPIEHAFQQVNAEIGKHRNSFDLTLERIIDSDPVLLSLGEILDGQTGVGFTEEEAARHLVEAQRRATDKIPPGYKDAGKTENAHGDFFVWEQLLVESEKDSDPLLFVTNDAKEDWVRKEAGLIVGARPELVAEFKERCDADFLILQLGRFLQIAKEALGVSVSESTVAQAEALVGPLPATHIYTLPDKAYLEVIDALHAESRMNAENAPHLSMEERRQARHKARKVGTVLDNLQHSARRRGEQVHVRLTREEMNIVMDTLRRQRPEDSFENESSSHEATKSQKLRTRIKQLESELAEIRSDLSGNETTDREN
ncbi:PIN domain-containing protein [Streptomyces sp. NBC_01635]|uniref:PIN-like domain-containing protein n=1 Tax=Streptomyces sp. NBC_01635 TaxID=2975904 RepID=UPI00386C0C6B|nr:PIN domain-containing protein [Streptomyces sp. NBC_01635]